MRSDGKYKINLTDDDIDNVIDTLIQFREYANNVYMFGEYSDLIYHGSNDILKKLKVDAKEVE